MAFPVGSTDINDLTALVSQQSEQIRLLRSQIDGLTARLDPWTGELKNVQCGFLRLDRDGLTLVDNNSSGTAQEGLVKYSAQTSGVYIYGNSAWRTLSSW